LEKEINPPHIQLRLQLLFNVGIFPNITVLEPGVQGATVAGMHGIGVSTPNAAVVAAATVGLANELHMPNGRIFTMGLLSMMLAAGILLVVTRFCGNTTRELGAAPNEQLIMAPIHTCCGMIKGFYVVSNILV
jgi:uncharacterized membrane protein YvlD (DUF360 family)